MPVALGANSLPNPMLLQPVLSAATVAAIERRMLVSAASAVAGAAVAAALRPNVARFIPYVGWALTFGTVLYASYEAYNARAIDWTKLETETYTAEALIVFRAAFNEARQECVDSKVGREAEEREEKYILIPAEIMPMIAAVDLRGMAEFGASLRWNPTGKNARRQAAMRGRPPAGPILVGSDLVRGSWEEYPFASTYAARAGAHVERVPLRENWVQGGFIRAASMVQRFQEHEAVTCFII